VIIYFSPVRWESIVQRPQRFFHWLRCSVCAPGEEPVWVDPYPTRLPKWGDFSRLGGAPLLSSALPRPTRRIKPVALPAEPVGALRPLVRACLSKSIRSLESVRPSAVVVGKPSLLSLELTRRLPQSTPVFMDIMDDLPAFLTGRSAQWMEQLMSSTQNRAREVWVSSENLRRRIEKGGQVKSLKLVRNGVDTRRSMTYRYCWQLRDRPVVAGYVGTIAAWFDWEVVSIAAARNPNIEFRLYGPIDSGASIPSNRSANVVLCGPLDAGDVAATLGSFDLGLIPFKRSRLTESVDPIKYYEYRAAGLGIASTAFGDMSARDAKDGVFFFDQSNWLGQAHSETLRLRSRGQWLESEINDFSWEHRFHQTGLQDWFRERP